MRMVRVKLTARMSTGANPNYEAFGREAGREVESPAVDGDEFRLSVDVPPRAASGEVGKEKTERHAPETHRDKREVPGGKAPQRNRHNKSCTELLISMAPFARLVVELLAKVSVDFAVGGVVPKYRIQVSAIEALQVATEGYIVGLFEAANLIVIADKRATVLSKDIISAVHGHRAAAHPRCGPLVGGPWSFESQSTTPVRIGEGEQSHPVGVAVDPTVSNFEGDADAVPSGIEKFGQVGYTQLRSRAVSQYLSGDGL